MSSIIQFCSDEYHNVVSACQNFYDSPRDKTAIRDLAGAVARIAGLVLALLCASLTLHAAYVGAGGLAIGGYALLTLLSRDVYIVGCNLNMSHAWSWVVRIPPLFWDAQCNFIHKLPFIFSSETDAESFKRRLVRSTQDTLILSQIVAIL